MTCPSLPRPYLWDDTSLVWVPRHTATLFDIPTPDCPNFCDQLSRGVTEDQLRMLVYLAKGQARPALDGWAGSPYARRKWRKVVSQGMGANCGWRFFSEFIAARLDEAGRHPEREVVRRGSTGRGRRRRREGACSASPRRWLRWPTPYHRHC